MEFTNRYYEKISVSFFQQEKVKKRPKEMHFIVENHCITILTEDFQSQHLNVNCKVFRNVTSLFTYLAESSLIGKLTCSLEFDSKKILKEKLKNECIRLKNTPESWVFLKLSHY